jgi:hypothetical protein
VKKTIQLGAELELPKDAVTQTFAFLARRGAGKTYGAQKLCEGMLELEAQVVVIDPVGNWYGLRLAADGKGKGFAIPVLGGLHGDIPLEPNAGHLVADLVIDRRTSVVLDVSMMRKGERKTFVTAFAEQLFHRKKSTRSPLHLFVEEAQVFVPQRVQSDEARMLGAFEDLVKLGRNFGVGVTLISQRPQAVNKDALNQTECLVVLQTNGAQERKALREWIVDQGLDVGQLIDTLPSLKKGEAWVWSPSWLGITKRIHIGKKRTFNASATPEVGVAELVEKALAPVDLEALQAAMADTIKAAESTDPKALRRRVAELEAQLKKAPTAAPARVEVKEVPVLSEAQVKRLEAVAAAVLKGQEKLAAVLAEIAPAIRLVRSPADRAPPPAVRAPPEPARRAARSVKDVATPRAEPRGRTARLDGEGLGKGEHVTLTAIAQHAEGVGRDQLSVLTGYKRSTRNTYLQRLGAAGLIDQRGELIVATPSGIEWLGPGFEPLPQGEELRKHWLQRLPEGERRILEAVLQHYPESVDRELLSDSTGYTRSSRNTYLQRLGARRLIESSSGGQVRASSTLFLSGAA